MEDNLSNLALVNALNEIKKADSNVTKLFIFQDDKVLAKDEKVGEEEAYKTVKAFQTLKEHADTVDGVETITLKGAQERLDITQINGYYLTIITPSGADDESITNLTHVLAPNILQKTFELPQSSKQMTEIVVSEVVASEEVSAEVIQPEIEQEALQEIQQSIEQMASEAEIETEPTPSLTQQTVEELHSPSTEYAEFTVDTKGGLGLISGSADTVRLDAITVGRWTERYGEGKISKIMINEPNSGQKTECTFEQITDDKYDHEGLALLPEPILRALKIKKGAKILVKPLLSDEAPEDNVTEEKNQEDTQTHACRERFVNDGTTCQMMVADISGFNALREPYTVRFDQGLLERWREFYGEEEIEEVTISDTFLGKTLQCKFKIVKDEKFQGKGLIQMPKAIRQELEVKEGSLVLLNR